MAVDATLPLSQSARFTAGVIFLTVVAVEYGGTFMLRVARGRVEQTAFQRAFERAGHAHAGVLVILALVSQLYVDALTLDGVQATLARSGVAAAAILMPAGFFFSSAGRGRTEANRFVVLIWLGAAALATGIVTLGFALIRSA